MFYQVLLAQQRVSAWSYMKSEYLTQHRTRTRNKMKMWRFDKAPMGNKSETFCCKSHCRSRTFSSAYIHIKRWCRCNRLRYLCFRRHNDINSLHLLCITKLYRKPMPWLHVQHLIVRRTNCEIVMLWRAPDENKLNLPETVKKKKKTGALWKHYSVESLSLRLIRSIPCPASVDEIVGECVRMLIMLRSVLSDSRSPIPITRPH